MTPLQFVQRHRYAYIDFPGGAGEQCVDLANEYLREVLGIGPFRANAVDWQHAVIPGTYWVPNTPNNYPGIGSLVVWGPYAPEGIGRNGHIALAIAADAMDLLSFDQNWPAGNVCALISHHYGGVAGWIAPRGGVPPVR